MAQAGGQHFRQLIESVVDYAILTLDTAGRVASWNAGAQRILGYDAAEIIGQPVSRLFRREDVEQGLPAAELAGAAGAGRYEDEGWRVRKDGSQFRARAVVTTVKDAAGRPVGYAKVLLDLTDYDRAAEELLRAKMLAEKASVSKSQFLANMSHELRTPLNSLLILARLLADNQGGNLSAKQVQFARTIHDSGMDLLNLINDLLDLAKIESGAATALNVSVVPLADVVQELERGFRQIAYDKGLDLRVESRPGLPQTLRTDPMRVKQVLKNLLSNAFKFTAAGGVVLRIEPLGDASVAFSVTDTGIGISHDKLEVIFEPFQQVDGTTSRKYGGTGLGLSISREIARLLGGEIRVASEPGRGSTFTLIVPVTEERA